MDKQGKKQFSFLDQFKVIKTLGSGYNAVVKLAQDTKGQLVAIKRYKTQTSDLQTLIDELTIMKNLNQQNIVRLVAVRDSATYTKKDGSSYKCFAIVLQYCGGGQLFDFVCDTGKFSERVTRTYFHQMMSGLHYVHQKGYAHRDIKPQNLLLTNQFKLKIADFGFSILWKGKDGTGILHTKLGTQGYMAPEIYSKNYEGKQTDVFAAGVILFIMYAGCPPFQRSNQSDPYFKLLKAKQFDKFWKYHERKRNPGYFGEAFRSLFVHMTAYDPKQRPTIQQIANHPWVKQQLCTHSQIKAQFTKRKQYLDTLLQKRYEQQQEQRKIHLHQISTQAESQNRSGDVKQTGFLQIYNKQTHLKRKLGKISGQSRDTLKIKQNSILGISLLKNKLKTIQISLFSQQQNLLVSQVQSSSLIFSKFQDNQTDEIIAIYSYKYGTDTMSNENVKIKLILGIGQDQNLEVNFIKVQGNVFYYKKILAEIRKGFVKKGEL